MILTPADLFLVAAVSGAGLAAIHLERTRVRWTSRRRRPSPRLPETRSPRLVRPGGRPFSPPLDAAEQLRIVSDAEFRSRRLMNRGEHRVFEAAERAIRDQRLAWRVMAQVSLGEILASPDEAAFRAINSKRVDILVISRDGRPIVAIEHQGSGHHLGASAPARDAVKKEALRKAGVRYLEVTDEHGPDDIARELARIAGTRAPPVPA